MIERSSPPRIVYSPSSCPFKWIDKAEGEWWNADFVFFCIPELEPGLQVLNCVAETRTLVATASTWTLRDDPNAVAIDAAMADLRAVVSAIREARPLPAHPELDELLTQAAASHGTPGDVAAWAHQLADDIAGLAD
jgi:hypothetical protein